MDNLFKYYNLTEAVNTDLIMAKLELLSQDLKIIYDYNTTDEILTIEDLDLDEDELDNLLEIFDNNQILPDIDRYNDDEDDYDNLDYYSDGDDDYDF